jgi:periplasmic divalent cation tolerance protein
MADSSVNIVYTTVGSEEEAVLIARTVVEEKLAACANIIPSIRSIYRWQGKVEDESESLIFIKTRSDSVEALIARIKELHTYDVPDIIAIPIEKGYQPYLDWVVENS